MPLGQIIDIILIATQTVRPADGSNYIINYFGPRLTPVQLDNDTYIQQYTDGFDFDNSNKKSIPKFPKKIAVLTACTGAAIRDIYSTINK